MPNVRRDATFTFGDEPCILVGEEPAPRRCGKRAFRCVASWRGLPIASSVSARQTPRVQPWDKLAEETVYSRYRRVVSKRFRLPGGEVVDYEIKDEDDMVAVLALTDERQVVLVRQFRPGPEAVLLELPAGVVEAGEEPADTAAAELLEETGYAGRIEPAGVMLEEGYSNRTKFVFVAHGCTRQGRARGSSPDGAGSPLARRLPQPSAGRQDGRRRRGLSGSRPSRVALIYVRL